MDIGNQSVVSEFVLLGICHSWDMQILLLMILSILYLTVILGNIFVTILVITDLHLHSPMYFLLASLSFVDILLTSFTTPKIITDYLREIKTIFFGGCMCQILFVHLTAGSEIVLLVVMASDCLVAICKPLHYSTIMSLYKCNLLVLDSWAICFLHGMSQMAVIAQMPFCGPMEVDSFFCDIPLVVKLVHMDSYTLGILMNADSGILTMTCFILLLISYTYIVLTVCQSSKTGTSKALSTCTAHITVVILFFVSGIFIYVWSLSITWVDKFLAVFYSVLTPLLNPSIYSLRNKEIKKCYEAISKQAYKYQGKYLTGKKNLTLNSSNS